MATDDPNELERIDREIRINELKHEADELTGGQMTAWESDDCPAEIAQQFWQRVVDYERGPWTSHFQQLVEAGVDLPAPDEMDDQRLAAKLREVIYRLAAMRVFLESTDHLSDRELYTVLWQEVLHEQVKAMPFDAAGAWHLDLVSSGSEEDIELYLKYYADEDWRRHWHESFPDDAIPAHEDPPYDRDRHLPRPDHGAHSGAELGEG
jgi:hypothetical protein